ncbi:MAG: hypothetical protein M3M87_05210 [Thermoproteota archaeon]|nr:hypothetical protein [Thermoproteota archaeon]
MYLGVTVIADGKSLVQNYFTFTSINKVSQFFLFLSVAAEKHYSKRQQNKFIDHFADRDRKEKRQSKLVAWRQEQRGCTLRCSQ